MKLLKLFPLAMLLTLVGCGGGASSNAGGTTGFLQAPPGATIITIPPGATDLGEAAYGANPLHLPLGTSVSWYNGDAMEHTATGVNEEFDTGAIGPEGYSDPIVFNTP